MSSPSCSDSDSSDVVQPDIYGPIKRLADQMIQPRNPNKPLTSFFIADILNGRTGRTRNDHRGGLAMDPLHHHHHHHHRPNGTTIVRPWACSPGSSQEEEEEEMDDEEDEDIDIEIDVEDETPPLPTSVSPLDALLQMTSKTFQGIDAHGANIEDVTRKDQLSLFSKTQPAKKRRKSRTAFTNHQIYELEKRFLYQKYLTPADRDEIASSLGLSNAQVITWFQNRRAKLKRDLEELKADVIAAKTTPDPLVPSPESRAVFGNIQDDLQMFNKHGCKKATVKGKSPNKDSTTPPASS